MTAVESIAAALAAARDVAVVSHIIPDGDCLGSTLALTLALRQRGRGSWPLTPTRYRRCSSFCPARKPLSRRKR